MPLRSGKSRATISHNIKTLIHDWEEDGTLGNSRPESRRKAQRQAVAISLDKAGVSNRRPKSRDHRRTRDDER
ncbi:MAG: hypothetical protein REI09_01790 [Candidatus Dactylopiibacterium sp.]|nr:hypothetical protein [Candidatus Dactylopiibacterium sp.]